MIGLLIQYVNDLSKSTVKTYHHILYFRSYLTELEAEWNFSILNHLIYKKKFEFIEFHANNSESYLVIQTTQN